jgi:hypothetical protein
VLPDLDAGNLARWRPDPEPEDGRRLRRLATAMNPPDVVTALGFSADDRMLAAGAGNTVVVRDVRARRPAGTALRWVDSLPAVAGLLVCTAIVGAADLRAEMVAFLSQDNDDLVVCALSALRAAYKAKR